jgi:hypothetical protein
LLWKEEIQSRVINVAIFPLCSEWFSSLVFMKISVRYVNFCNHVVLGEQFGRCNGGLRIAEISERSSETPISTLPVCSHLTSECNSIAVSYSFTKNFKQFGVKDLDLM